MATRSTILVVCLVFSGCAGETSLEGGRAADARQTSDSGAGGDPFAPCTDYASCCTQQDIVCTGDPDNNPTCKCMTLWDCTKDEQKCQQDTPVPDGGGSWTCVWTEQTYACKGTTADGSPPGGSGWTCNKQGSSWVCTKAAPPNPSNKPGGTSVWTCNVDDAAGKIVCERKGAPPTPTADAGVPPTPDTGVPTPDSMAPDTTPPLPKTELNCADGIDNDGDGKVDCKDEDCPACPPPPCPPGTECCDGKDNDGDGRIDEGNVCAGVGEPCPPGAFQSCDCYCGVHRKCLPDGTWGPCKVDGNNTCAVAQVNKQSQCPWGSYCDYGKCVPGFILFGQCKSHNDCPTGKVCDLGKCINDIYFPCP